MTDNDDRWPLDDEGRASVQRLRDDLLALGEATGEWTGKSDLRETGMSLHLRWERRTDLREGALKAQWALMNAPGLLIDALDRLLTADDAARADR